VPPPERHTHRASLVRSTVRTCSQPPLSESLAASAEPWQSEPRRSVPVFGFSGPASPCKYAFSLPFWVFSNPKTTTKTACFLRLLPAPVIVWISSPANRSKNARRMWPRPKRQYTTTEPDPPLASKAGDGYDFKRRTQPWTGDPYLLLRDLDTTVRMYKIVI
jgi:hypothetical protein